MSQTKAQLLGPLVADNVDVNGDLDFDSGTLKLDPTNNRVGINNSSPTTTLDVGGDIKLSGDITATGNITLKDLNYTADYPTIRPTLDLAFAKTKQLDSRITFTRNSIGTYTDENGIIKTAAVDEPRFDHDYTTGESLGLLIEESRTNLLSYSTSFNLWSSISLLSISVNSQTAPDGTQTAANFIFPTNPASTPYCTQLYTFSNAAHTFSVFAKYNGIQYLWLNMWDGGVSRRAIFDIQNGTLGSTQNSPSGQTITAYPNGWYRCTITATTGASSGDVSIRFANSSSDFASDTITGNGVDGQYIWGAQLEQGAFATSYISTSGSTATRDADIATITGTNFSSWYTPNQFTLYGEGRSITGTSNVGGSAALVSIDDNTNNYRFILRRSNGTNQALPTPGYSGFTFRYYKLDDSLNLDAFPPSYSGSSQYDATGVIPSYWTDTSLHKMVMSTNNSDISQLAGYGDGYSANFANTGNGFTGTETLTPYTQATQMQIGNGASSKYWNGQISRITYYPRRLNNSQLQNITL